MESQLIPRAKSRDPEALAQLLVDLAPLTKSTIRRIQPYAQDPDNLYGEANLILLDALDDFDPERGVPFHLYYRTRLSYFLMDDLKRSMKKATVPLTNEMEAVVADVANTEEDFILLERAEELHQIVNDLPLRERAEELHQIVNDLPLRERAVVSLYFFCHLSLSEIAGRLGISYQTVANTKTRAMNHLRRIYATKQTVDSL